MKDKPELRWKSTHFSDERQISVGKFVGAQVYGLGLSLVLGISVVGVLVHSFNWPVVTSALLGASLPIVTAWVLLKFVVDKPRGYMTDLLEWKMRNLSKTSLLPRNQRGSQYASRIEGDAVIHGDPESSLIQGVRIELPGWENRSEEELLSLESMIRGILGHAQNDIRLQFKWSTGSYDRAILKRYFDDTELKGSNAWCREQRNFNIARLAEQNKSGVLREPKVQLFLSKPLSSGENAVQTAKAELRLPIEDIIRRVKSLGGYAQILSESDLIELHQKHFHVSDKEGHFDPNVSILDTLLEGEIEGCEAPGASICVNGVHHGFAIMNSVPLATIPGMMASIALLEFNEFSISLKVRLIDRDKLIQSEESEVEKLERAYRANGKESLTSTSQSIRQRIKRLLTRESHPMHFQLFVHCWADSPEHLSKRLKKASGMIEALNAAKSHVLEVPTSCCKAFFNTMPASGYSDDQGKQYLEDVNLADLVPICGGNGELGTKNEALFNAAHGSLHGLNTFSPQTGSPLHCMVTGKTGVGKSCTVSEVATQTGIHFDTTVILDSGKSHACFVMANDKNARVLEIDQHSKEVLNYMSTNGSPFSPEHLQAVVPIVGIFAAKFIESVEYGESLISEKLNEFYEYWATRGDGVKVKDGSTAWYSFYHNLPEEKQPTHSDFQAWLKEDSKKESEFSHKVSILALILSRWCKGKGGPSLFDGVGTVSLTGKTVYVELGKLASAPKEIKAVTAHIISNIIVSHLMRLPRDLPKRIIVEELGAFLDIEGAHAVIRNLYERMRKNNVWVCAVIQQISNLPNEIAASVLGNCSQAIILPQKYEADVRMLQKAFNLPDAAVQRLKSFGPPTKETGAPFLHMVSEGERVQVNTAYSIASPEMLYVSDSGGKHFEKREKALAQYDDILEGISIEARKP
ncbi:MAG: VirB4 family type IV secretion system protein [Opitutales bacterium]